MHNMSKLTPIYTKVTDGIWIGNETSVTVVSMLISNNITAVINLTGTDIYRLFGADQWYDCIDVIDFLLPNQELMDTEIPKVTNKLDTIANEINKFRAQGKCVLIQCIDGKNKSMLAAGYYLIVDQKRQHEADPGKVRAVNVDDIISNLETIYYTQAQKDDERHDLASWDIDPDLIEEKLLKLTPEARKKLDQDREGRRAVRGLTMPTFRKLLRLKK
jgi:hypothetical protein